MCRHRRGIDTAISEKETADYTAGVTLGKGSDGNLYVLDVLNQHLTFNKQISEIQRIVMKFGVNNTYVGDVGYQQALIQELKRVGGLKIVPVKPTRDKVARLNSVSGFFESNRVHFLKDQRKIVDQLLTFPGSPSDHDDMVDAIGMALAGMREGGSGLLVLRM